MQGIRGYFACPLASGDNPEKAKAMVGLIEKMGYQVLDRHVIVGYDESKGEFCKNSGIKPEDYGPIAVRWQDLNWVLESEFMVLDCTNGSWGGGIELHHATVVRQLLPPENPFSRPIPILCLRQKDSRPSYLIWGIDPKQFPMVWLREYKDLKEALNIIIGFFSHFFPKKEDEV